jgi:hypothetical protein
MPSYFNLTLDTLPPVSPSLLIAGGAAYTATQLVNCAIGTSDGDTTGYQMKIWGAVDPANDADVQVLEANSNWTTFVATKQVKLSAGDGSKTLYLKIRDSVLNESAQASDSIGLDTTVPVATISISPDVPTISKQSGKNTCSFGFQSNEIFDEYKIKLVPTTNSIHSAGVLIEMTNGSTNMSGASGNYPADTNINCTIKGADFEAAGAIVDAQSIVKVFVKDKSGQWSTI